LCRAAAIVAGASPETVERYAQFGRNLGIALQISNDIRAVSMARGDRNDLAVAKRTLPLVFAFEHSPTLAQQFISATQNRQLTLRDARRLCDLVHTTGGVLYASVIADFYFEEASASLDQAGCAEDSQLRTLLRSMRK
jgi:geranylgeranyl pyrophosphate synthase